MPQETRPNRDHSAKCVGIGREANINAMKE